MNLFTYFPPHGSNGQPSSPTSAQSQKSVVDPQIIAGKTMFLKHNYLVFWTVPKKQKYYITPYYKHKESLTAATGALFHKRPS